jgi:hypothetical protein
MTNYFFTVIFTSELIINIIGFGKRYFKNNWNIFDFIIVTTTLLGIFLTNYMAISLGQKTTIIRSFRIVRIFLMLKGN